MTVVRRALENSLNILAVSTAKQVFALVYLDGVLPTTTATFHLHNNHLIHSARCLENADYVTLFVNNGSIQQIKSLYEHKGQKVWQFMIEFPNK